MLRVIGAVLSLVRAARSRTTQNGVVGVGLVVALLEALRARWPEYVLWSPEADVVIEGAVIAVLGPYVGRLVAFLRDPSKLRRAGILALLLCVGLTGTQGCTTTSTLPDGTVVVTTTDWQAVFQSVDAALERYERIEARRDAARAAGDAERAERLDAILAAIAEAVDDARTE